MPDPDDEPLVQLAYDSAARRNVTHNNPGTLRTNSAVLSITSVRENISDPASCLNAQEASTLISTTLNEIEADPQRARVAARCGI